MDFLNFLVISSLYFKCILDFWIQIYLEREVSGTLSLSFSLSFFHSLSCSLFLFIFLFFPFPWQTFHLIFCRMGSQLGSLLGPEVGTMSFSFLSSIGTCKLQPRKQLQYLLHNTSPTEDAFPPLVLNSGPGSGPHPIVKHVLSSCPT